jgi:hypothetical protein
MAWSQSDLGTMSQHVPGSTDSMRAPWPMSLQITPQRMNSQNLDGAFTGTPYDTHLAPPGPRISMNHENIYPISYQNDAPWSALGMRTASQNASPHRFGPSNTTYRGYPPGPGSEMSSTAPKSDSGYITQRAASVLSHERERRDQELPTEITRKVSSMHVGSVTSEPPEMVRMSSDQRSVSQLSVRSGTRTKQLPCSLSS